MSEIGTRVYELGYVLAPTVSEGEVPAATDTLKAALSAISGELTSEGGPEFIDLAYPMEKNIGSKKMKYSQGYFGWIKFAAAPEAIEALKKALDGMDMLIRYILVKTSVDNTVVFKKPKGVTQREPIEEVISEEVLEEEVESDEDMKEDHEKLPDVATDLDAAPASSEEATNE